MLELTRSTLRRATQVRLPQAAAMLTLTTALSIVPLLAVAFALFRRLPVFRPLEVAIEQHLLKSLLPADLSGAVLKYLHQFATNASGLPWAGSLVVLAGALARRKYRRIGVEYSTFGQQLGLAFGAAEFMDIEPDLYEFRRRKDPDELARLEKAIAATSRARCDSLNGSRKPRATSSERRSSSARSARPRAVGTASRTRRSSGLASTVTSPCRSSDRSTRLV